MGQRLLNDIAEAEKSSTLESKALEELVCVIFNENEKTNRMQSFASSIGTSGRGKRPTLYVYEASVMAAENGNSVTILSFKRNIVEVDSKPLLFHEIAFLIISVHISYGAHPVALHPKHTIVTSDPFPRRKHSSDNK